MKSHPGNPGLATSDLPDHKSYLPLLADGSLLAIQEPHRLDSNSKLAGEDGQRQHCGLQVVWQAYELTLLHLEPVSDATFCQEDHLGADGSHHASQHKTRAAQRDEGPHDGATGHKDDDLWLPS